MSPPHNGSTWIEYKRLILADLDRLRELAADAAKAQTEVNDATRDQLAELRTEMAMLKVKAAMLGAVIGGLTSAGTAWAVSRLTGG